MLRMLTTDWRRAQSIRQPEIAIFCPTAAMIVRNVQKRIDTKWSYRAKNMYPPCFYYLLIRLETHHMYCAENEKQCWNKKVLLRERKRHTARHVAVASACYFGGRGLPRIPAPRHGMGTPPEMGYPPRHGMGYPPEMGYPPRHGMGYPTEMGYPPIQGWGTPPFQGWIGYPPQPRLDRVPPLSKAGLGTPPPIQGWIGYPPPPKCGQTENITSRHPSDAGGNNIIIPQRYITQIKDNTVYQVVMHIRILSKLTQRAFAIPSVYVVTYKQVSYKLLKSLKTYRWTRNLSYKLFL